MNKLIDMKDLLYILTMDVLLLVSCLLKAMEKVDIIDGRLWGELIFNRGNLE